MKCITLFVCVCVFGIDSAVRAEDTVKLPTPKGWRNERLKLPPDFAPKMKLKGVEDLRFAPGMFDPKSESFFSYLFLLQVEGKSKLTDELLQSELLKYYQGLAKSVLAGRNIKVSESKFKLSLKPIKAKQVNQPKSLVEYSGDLKWIEPFATAKPQTLLFEIQTWHNNDSKQNLIFVCVSPKGKKAEIWKQLHSIRASFFKASGIELPKGQPKKSKAKGEGE
jgi:hypothetical protein